MLQEERTNSNSNKLPGSEPSLLLVNGDLWEKFHREDNEMIITKSGRCLFPLLQFKAVDLDPDTTYSIDVDFEMLDRRRYRFVDGTWKCAQPWKKSASDEDEDENESDDGEEGNNRYPPGLQESYTHPDLCQLGAHWMQKTVSFSKLKLTNRIPDKAVVRTQKRSKDPPATSSHIFHLTSFHRYRPRVHLVQRSSQRRSVVASTTFTFDRTAFMAVTHYQNFRVNDLKKGHNPHAKGFRDTIQQWPTDPGAASRSTDSSKLSRNSKHSWSYSATDSGSEGGDTVNEEDDAGAGISEDFDMEHSSASLDGSDSRVVTPSRDNHAGGNRAISADRELDCRATKVEIHEGTSSAARRVDALGKGGPKDDAKHTLPTSSQAARSVLDYSLYDVVPLTKFHQSSRTRASRKSKTPSALHTQAPPRASGSRKIQTYTGYGTPAYSAPLFRQPYLATDVQKGDVRLLTSPLTPMPEPILPLEQQLSPPSNDKPEPVYVPQVGEAAAHLSPATMAPPTPTSWYQQFFSWDQPSPCLTLPSRTPDDLSTLDTCLMQLSTSMPLQLHPGQTVQEAPRHEFPSGSHAESDIQSQPPSLNANVCLIPEPFSGPDARAIPYTTDLPTFSYEGDRLAFNYAQTDTCHIWPSILESKTVMSTSSVFSILPCYEDQEQMNLDMVLQENLRLKAFIRERYGSEAEAEANAVMVMGRHH